MQDIALVVAFVGIIVFLAHLFTGIFSRTKIPDVLLLTAIGICVGPILGLTSPDQFGQVGPVFTIITLVIILFESGITLRLGTLRCALGGAITLAPLCFFLTMSVAAGFALWLTDLELIPAFILGAIVGSTSETVVIPLVRQLKIREDTQTLLSVESSLNDVLSIIITIALVQAYTLGEFNIASISGDLIASFLVAIFFGIAGAFLWSILLNRFHAIKNAMFTTPAFVFVVFGIVEILGFSGAIAALAFGITIGNIETIRFPFFKKDLAKEPVGLTNAEKVFFSEIAFLLKTFFFVYLGISLELISGRLIVFALVFTILAFVVRLPAVKLSVKRSLSLKDVSIISIMVPKGLAAVVLASIPIQEGVVGGELIKNITYGVVLISIVMTAIFVLLIDKTKLSDSFGWILSPKMPKLQFRKETCSDSTKLQNLTHVVKRGTKIASTGTKLFGRKEKNE
jgi:cell volume regulation protein A